MVTMCPLFRHETLSRQPTVPITRGSFVWAHPWFFFPLSIVFWRCWIAMTKHETCLLIGRTNLEPNVFYAYEVCCRIGNRVVFLSVLIETAGGTGCRETGAVFCYREDDNNNNNSPTRPIHTQHHLRQPPWVAMPWRLVTPPRSPHRTRPALLARFIFRFIYLNAPSFSQHLKTSYSMTIVTPQFRKTP